jgi:putative spermidine/putrescine transport system permease protein
MTPMADTFRKQSTSSHSRPWLLMAPAMAVVGALFCGGLILGFIQALGYIPAAGMTHVSLAHFRNAIMNPDFFGSLIFTFYISVVSTLVASTVATFLALALDAFSGRSRFLAFFLQIPLTVPHLVAAVAMIFLLSPSGWFSRLLSFAGVIDSADHFPFLVNDPWGIGIMTVYVWKEIPFIGFMVLAALKQGASELMAVGRTLKAGPFQRFKYILLPIISPSLGAASLIVFAYTFGSFEVPFLLGQTYPMMLPVQAYKNYADIDLAARPEGIALSLIIAFVVVVSIIVSQRLAQLANRRGIF